MTQTSLPSRRLGAELTVPAPGLGCMGMSDFYGPSNEAECHAVLDRAADLGVTFWDTSDMYGKGANEALISRWFATRGRRDEITLATKFGIVRGAGGNRVVCGRPDYVREACDYSLARLGLDTIDLYYQHRVDPDVPIEETVGAMADLVTAGKVRYLGLSEAGAETIRRAHAVHPIAALQSEWSLWSRDIEAGPVPACRELGIGIVPYSPARPGLPHRPARPGQPAARGLPPQPAPDDRGRARHQPGALSTLSPRSPPATMSTLDRSRWPGCSPAERTFPRSPAPAASPTWSRTPPRPPSP